MSPVFAVTDEGRRIYVDPEDPRAARLVEAAGDLNPLSRVLWRKAVAARNWDLVVDVGANYGEMLIGSPFPADARLVAFEPNPSLRPYLERTLAENGLDVEVRPEAVSASRGTARFAVDSKWSGKSSLDQGHVESAGDRYHVLEVSLTTLDDLIGTDGASFCVKVDVEGFEREVVAGAGSALERSEHWTLMLEVAHMDRSWLSKLAQDWTVHVMDRRTGRLLGVPGGNAALASQMLASGWIYPQDCLVSSKTTADLLENLA